MDAVVVIYVPPLAVDSNEVAAAIARGAAQVPPAKPVASVFLSSKGAPPALARGRGIVVQALRGAVGGDDPGLPRHAELLDRPAVERQRRLLVDPPLRAFGHGEAQPLRHLRGGHHPGRRAGQAGADVAAVEGQDADDAAFSTYAGDKAELDDRREPRRL